MLFSIITALAALLQFGVGFLILWGKYNCLFNASAYAFVIGSFMMAARNLTAFVEVETSIIETFYAFLDNVYYPLHSVLMLAAVLHYMSVQYKKKKAS